MEGIDLRSRFQLMDRCAIWHPDLSYSCSGGSAGMPGGCADLATGRREGVHSSPSDS